MPLFGAANFSLHENFRFHFVKAKIDASENADCNAEMHKTILSVIAN